MIIHFVKDEKIVDQLIENFLLINSDDIFIIFDAKNAEGYKHIHSTNISNVLNINDVKINTISGSKEVDAILLHGLYPEFLKIIGQVGRNVKIGWFCWGFGVYSMPLIYENIIAPKTKQILRKDISRNITNRLRSSSIFRKFYFFINKNRNNNLLLHYEGVSRIKYFISFIKEDYEIYSTYYPNKLEFIDCTFSSVDQYVAKESADFVNDDANNVLLGNSNTPENNHVDAMFKFKDRLHENQKVYTILSYGPDEYYKKKVIKEGQKYLGKSFVPVLGFLERTEYIQMLKTCSVGVFYHYRQQAMGNIIAMLYLGSRIYMSSKSPAYRFLKRNGIFVFDLDKEYEIFGSDRLPLNDVLKNREILESIFSKDKVIEDLRRLTKTLKR